MSETIGNTGTSGSYVGYEYMDVTVKRDMEAVYADCYPNFGWVLDGSYPAANWVLSSSLKFKRDRKVRNRAEITRLQRQFESCAHEIERLEQTKTVAASAAAYTTGIVGTAFMAGSVFSFIAGMVPLSIVLAVPGFVGWIVPYFNYNRIKARKVAQVSPLIDQQHDAIYEICEKANALLTA